MSPGTQDDLDFESKSASACGKGKCRESLLCVTHVTKQRKARDVGAISDHKIPRNHCAPPRPKSFDQNQLQTVRTGHEACATMVCAVFRSK
jgi:hypothetical protein